MDEPRTQESPLRGLSHVLGRRWPIIVLCVVVTTASALGFSLLQTPRYTASASLLFRDPGFDQKLFGNTFQQPNQDPTRQAATNVELVSLPVVKDLTARRVGRGLTERAVEEMTEVESGANTDVVTINATDPDPAFAQRVANTFASQFVRFRQNADRDQIEQANRLVESQLESLSASDRRGARGRELRERGEQLQILGALQTGNAELVERADQPLQPSSPQTKRNTALAPLLGLLLGVGLAFLLERLDRRVRSQEELEATFGRPLLGMIPQSKVLARAGGVTQMASGDAEAFGALRANLKYFNVDREIRSIVVTSPMPGEGKTTVAWNLAVVAATAGARALLIEADLRHPGLATLHGGVGRAGLSTVLAGERALPDVAQKAVRDSQHGGEPFELSVVTAGPAPPNPAALLDSARMRSLLEDARDHYDFVVVDTPPLGLVADAIPLMRQVDGTIIVSRLGTTTRDSAEMLRRKVDNLDAEVLGIVVNGTERLSDDYGYGYGYGGKADAESEGRVSLARRGSSEGSSSAPREPDQQRRRSDRSERDSQVSRGARAQSSQPRAPAHNGGSSADAPGGVAPRPDRGPKLTPPYPAGRDASGSYEPAHGADNPTGPSRRSGGLAGVARGIRRQGRGETDRPS